MGAAALGTALVSLSCLHPTEPSGTCTQVATYNIGDVVNDSLSSGDCKQVSGALVDYYQFTTAGQQDFSIAVSSPGVLTFLQLYDQRTAIVMNSALTSSVDTTTTVRMKIGSGNWLIAVNAVNSGATGHYRLTTVADTSPVTGCGTIWLTPGVTTTQTITAADCTSGPNGGNYYYHRYAVVLLQNEPADMSEHSTAFAPAMFLVGPTGTTASAPDSTGTTTLIETTILTQGAFNLWVGSANTNQFGAYTLQIH